MAALFFEFIANYHKINCTILLKFKQGNIFHSIIKQDRIHLLYF